MVYSTDDEELKGAKNKIRIIKMLQNQEQESAIQELVKNGTIQNFSKENMKKLVEKGNSTYEEDMKKFVDFMSKFQPAIMDIGSDIEDVEKKVNEKAQEMKPDSKVKNPNSERVSGEEKGVN